MKNSNSIGNTPLVELNSFEGAPLKAKVLIKDESKNPTGTHKDRKSDFLIRKALENDVHTLAILTSGNAGFSLATIAEGTGLRIVTIVSETIRTSIRESLENTSAEVHAVDLSKPFSSRDIMELARKSKNERIWDVTNSGHEAYRDIFAEIKHESPDLIVCPLGSGELYMGLCEGVESEGGTTKVIGIHPMRTVSKADKLCASHLPLREDMMRTQLLQAVRQGTSHGRDFISEEDIEWCVQNAPDFLDAEPSALVPLMMVRRFRDTTRKIVMISTGKGKVES